jgi:hypothetical protein
MSLGPTLVGGAIGAAVGMALHLIVEMATGFEAPWFAVVIGLLTGLGVHQANKSLAGRVSYLRGAVAAAIALLAIVGSTPLISLVASNKENVRNAATPINLRRSDDQAAAAPSDADAASQSPADIAASDRDLRAAVVTGHPGEAPQSGDFNLWQFVCMAIGTFIAYEFGRGTATPAPAASPMPQEPPVMTDPSN